MIDRRRTRSPGSATSLTPAHAGPAPGRTTRVAQLRPVIQRSASPEPIEDAGPDGVDQVERTSTAAGSSLPPELQARFATSLGADLSAVRVHTGPESESAARAVGAKAYAVGNDIHFAAGEYEPSSHAGQHLLAHEVAHTVQQQGAGPSRQHKSEVSTPGDSKEAEADRAADAMTSGRPFTVSQSAPTIQRGYREEVLELDKAKAVARKSMAQSDWYMVGRRLNGFSGEDIAAFVQKLSLGERAHTRGAAMAVAPELDRVVQAIHDVDKEATRISEVYSAYETAVAKPDWGRAAVLLNGMSRDDILRRISTLTWQQKTALRDAANGNARIDEAIETSEKRRVAAVHDAYDTAIRKGDWTGAANQLNGMSTEDLAEHLRALSFPNLMAVKAAAGVRVWMACEHEIAHRSEAGTVDELDKPRQVTEAVPVEAPLVDLPDFSSDGRLTKDAAKAGDWGGSATVEEFLTQLAWRYAERKADATIAEAKEPKPDRVPLIKKIAAERLAALKNIWDKTIAYYVLNDIAATRAFSTFARYFCADVREGALFDLKPAAFNWGHKFPATPADTTFEQIVKPGSASEGGELVKPILNKFIHAMPQSPPVTFYNYANHGSMGLQGKGYSLDVFVQVAPDDTGFYPREIALQVIHNIAATAGKVGGDWGLCYNDVSVATAAQKIYGAGRITYSGVSQKTDPKNARNWHGPLNLHIHMDLVPTTQVEPGIPTSASGIAHTNPDTESH